MASSSESDKKRSQILKVLRNCEVKSNGVLKSNCPSTSTAKTFGSNFTIGRGRKVEAVKVSFQPTEINLTEKSRETTRSKDTNKPLNNKQDKGGAQSTPQKKGNEIHRILSHQIKEGTRDGTGGGILNEMLKAMESKFDCEFIQADVRISGYAVKKRMRETQVDLWSGEMDAVAIRRSSRDVTEVFVVDWKTTSKTDLADIAKWWNGAAQFKTPLYQCLVYRELLQAHLKHNHVEALVGIILVPFHQSHPEIGYPGLCVDFKTMEEKHLLDKLKGFQWLAALDEAIDVHTIKLPCKLFKESSFDTADYGDKSTNILKDETRLKDILDDNATVADLIHVLNLPPILKVEVIKDEEKKSQKEGKTSVIESYTEDKTKRGARAGNQKGRSSTSHREAQDVTRISRKTKIRMKNSK